MVTNSETFGNVSFDGGKEVFAAVVNTATHPNEVYAGNVRRGALERISRHNEWLEDAELARQETIEWMHPDGTRVEGVLALVSATGEADDRYSVDGVIDNLARLNGDIGRSTLEDPIRFVQRGGNCAGERRGNGLPFFAELVDDCDSLLPQLFYS